MALPKDLKDSYTKREVSDFPVGANAATINWQGGYPTVWFHKILRVTLTSVITTNGRGGEDRWNLGKYEHDFHKVGSRQNIWDHEGVLYAPGDPRIAEAQKQRGEHEERQQRAARIRDIIKPLQPTSGLYGLPSTTDGTIREVIAELTALLPTEQEER